MQIYTLTSRNNGPSPHTGMIAGFLQLFSCCNAFAVYFVVAVPRTGQLLTGKGVVKNWLRKLLGSGGDLIWVISNYTENLDRY